MFPCRSILETPSCSMSSSSAKRTCVRLCALRRSRNVSSSSINSSARLWISARCSSETQNPLKHKLQEVSDLIISGSPCKGDTRFVRGVFRKWGYLSRHRTPSRDTHVFPRVFSPHLLNRNQPFSSSSLSYFSKAGFTETKETSGLFDLGLFGRSSRVLGCRELRTLFLEINSTIEQRTGFNLSSS